MTTTWIKKCWFLVAILLLSLPINATALRSSLDDFPFSLGVKDSLMIAHSFHGHPSFGPAGGLHGATYTADVEFLSKELHPELNWVIDIGKALDILSKVLSRYNLKNLDDVFPDNIMTTTEFMCKQIHDDICRLMEDECKDFKGAVRVKLWESHKAWATYTGLPLSSTALSDETTSEL